MIAKTWKEVGGETKVFRSADRSKYVTLSFSYTANNDGGIFSANRGRAAVYVQLKTEINEQKNVLINEKVGKARTAAEASKIARAYIKANGLRKQHKELAINLIGDE